jgi:hypothetical protein
VKERNSKKERVSSEGCVNTNVYNSKTGKRKKKGR